MLEILDIAECINGLHNCTQRCIELEGGYICACDEGYELDKDGVSCKGTSLCCIMKTYMSLGNMFNDRCR